MGKCQGWILLITCAEVCAKLYYSAGFDIEGAKDECFCADRVKKSQPLPLDITLSLPKKYFEQKEETYGPAY
jgi:hypothetical protein